MVILRKKKSNIQDLKKSKIFFSVFKNFYNVKTNFSLKTNNNFKNTDIKTECFYQPLQTQTLAVRPQKYFFLKRNSSLSQKIKITNSGTNVSETSTQTTSVFLNYCFDKGKLKNLITWFFNHCGEKATIQLVESLKDFGFHYATRSGSSIGLDDLKIPPTKPYLIFETESQLESTQNHYQLGMVTAVERFQHMIDLWQRTSETLKQQVIDYFRSTDLLNPVYMMSFSGARGNVSQVRQLVGMRGLMADPQGQLIEYPIRSNFREGMTLTEYLISCYGARKGLVDTALRTATSGYLTRRLVDAAQHITISKFDCKTNRTILLTNLKEGKKTLLPLENRLVGRVLGETINSQAVRNKQISTALALTLVKLKSQIMVRSPLTCKKTFSICQMCYGWSLAYGQLVPLGEAIGIIAAQSIGEPGTQLTMRTFHTGGVFSADLMDVLQSPYEGTIYFSQPLPGSMIRTAGGKIAFFTKGEGKLVVKRQSLTTEKDFSKSDVESKNYVLPSNTLLFVKQGEYVSKNQILAEFSSVSPTTTTETAVERKICSEMEGQVQLETSTRVKKNTNKTFKKAFRLKASKNLSFFWVLFGKLYNSGSLLAKNGDLVDSTTVFNVWNQTPNHLSEGFIILSKPFSCFQIKKKKTGQEKNIGFFQPHSSQKKNRGFSRGGCNKVACEEPTTKLFWGGNLQNRRKLLPGKIFFQKSNFLEKIPQKLYNSKQRQKGFLDEYLQQPQLQIFNKKQLKNWSFEKEYKTNQIQRNLTVKEKKVESLLADQTKNFLPETDLFKSLNSKNSFNLQKQSLSLKKFKLQTTRKKPKVFVGSFFLRSKAFFLTKYDFLKLKKFPTSYLQELVELAFQHRIFAFQIESIHYYKCGYVLKPFLPQTFFVAPKPKYLDLRQYQNQPQPFYSIVNKIKQKEKKQTSISPGIDNFLIGNSISQNSSLPGHNFSLIQLFSERLKAPTSGRFSLQKLFVNLQFDYGSVFWISEENYQLSKIDSLIGSKFLIFKNDVVGRNFVSPSLGKSFGNHKFFWKFLTSKWATRKLPIGSKISRQGFKTYFFPKLEGWSFLASGTRILQQKKSKISNSVLKSFRKDFQFFIHFLKANQLCFELTSSFLVLKSLLKRSLLHQQSWLEVETCKTTCNEKSIIAGVLHGKKLRFHVFSNPLIFYRYHSLKQQVQKPVVFTQPLKTLVSSFKKSKITSKLFFKTYFHLGTKDSFLKNRIDYAIQTNLLYSSSFLNFKNHHVLPTTELLEKVSKSFKNKTNLLYFSKYKKEKTNFVSLPIQVQLKKGWVYFPKNLKQAVKAHQKFNKVDKLTLDDLLFDQQMIVVECIGCFTGKKNVNFDGFEKSRFLKEKESFNKNKLYFDQFLQQEKLKLLQKTKKKKKIFSILNSHSIFGSSKLKDTLFEFSKQISNSDIVWLNDFTTKKKKNAKIIFVFKKLSTKLQQNYIFFNPGNLLRINSFFTNFLQRIRALFAGRSDLLQIFTNTTSLWYFTTITNETSEKNNFNSFFPLKTENFEKDLLVSTLSKVLKEYKIFSFNWRNFTQTFLSGFKEVTFTNYKKLFLNKLFIFDYIISFNLVFFIFLFNSNTVFSFAPKKYKLFNHSLLSFFNLPFEKDNESFYLLKKDKHSLKMRFLSNENNFFKKKPKFFTIIRKSVELSIVDTQNYRKTFLFKEPIQLKLKNENPVLNSLLYPKQKISFNDLQMYSNDDLQKPLWGIYVEFKPFLALNIQTFSKWFYTKQERFFGFNLSFRVPAHFPFKNLQLHFALAQNSFSRKRHVLKKLKEKANLLYFSNHQIAKKEKTFAFPTASLVSFQLNTKVFQKASKTKYNRYIKFQTIFQNRPKIEGVACESTPYEGEVITTSKKQGGELLITQLEYQSFLISKEKDQYQEKLSFSSEKLQIGNFFRSGQELAPNLVITASGQLIQIEKSKISLRIGQPFVHTSQGVLELQPGDVLSKNWPVMTFFYAKLKTEDIVQGIPKIEQLFEARPSPEVESLKLEFKIIYHQYKQQYQREHALLKSYEKIALLIVERIQRVYLSQGVMISDKHVEIIVKKVTSKVRFFDPETPVTKLFPEFISISTVIKKGQLTNQNQTPIEFLDSSLITLTARYISKNIFQKNLNTINPPLGKRHSQKFYKKTILISGTNKISQTESKTNRMFFEAPDLNSYLKNKKDLVNVKTKSVRNKIVIFPYIYPKISKKINTVSKATFLQVLKNPGFEKKKFEGSHAGVREPATKLLGRIYNKVVWGVKPSKPKEKFIPSFRETKGFSLVTNSFFLDFKNSKKNVKQYNSITKEKFLVSTVNNRAFNKKSFAFFSSIYLNTIIFEDSRFGNVLNFLSFSVQPNLVGMTQKGLKAGTVVEFIHFLNFFTVLNNFNSSRNNRINIQGKNNSILKNSTKLVVSLFPRAQNNPKTKNWSFQKNIEYLPCLVGITKETLNSDSFLAAASFQETIRVITRAVQSESTDFLLGIKERVILGERILAGTGDPSSLWLTSWLNYKFQRFVTKVAFVETENFTNLLVKSFLTNSPLNIKLKKPFPTLVKSTYLPLNTKFSQTFPKFNQVTLTERKDLKVSKVAKRGKVGFFRGGKPAKS